MSITEIITDLNNLFIFILFTFSQTYSSKRKEHFEYLKINALWNSNELFGTNVESVFSTKLFFVVKNTVFFWIKLWDKSVHLVPATKQVLLVHWVFVLFCFLNINQMQCTFDKIICTFRSLNWCFYPQHLLKNISFFFLLKEIYYLKNNWKKS